MSKAPGILERLEASKAPKARQAAFFALNQCLDKGVDAQAALDLALKSIPMSKKDKNLATELVYGTLRRKIRLDFIADKFLENPRKVPRTIRHILNIAAHELVFLEKVPDFAAVNWAVDLADALKPGLKNLVNAVLRKIAVLGDQAHDPQFYGNGKDAAFLSRFYSCPTWIVNLWLESYGRDKTLFMLKSQAETPATGLRVNPFHPEREVVTTALDRTPEILDRLGGHYAFPPGASIPGLKKADKHSYRRQSLAAAKTMHALEPDSWPGPVWDACCGRGGKTMLLLESREDIKASDINKSRLNGFRHDLEFYGYPAPEIQKAAAHKANPFDMEFGTVLLDVPCSGLGVLSRRPDTKYKRTVDDLTRLAATQAAILDQTAASVKSGGIIVYITCTMNPAENEGQIENFIAHHDFTLEKQYETPKQNNLGEFFWAVLLRKN